MLSKARGMTNDPKIDYRLMDLEHLALDKDIYDLVYSSLTWHYIVNIEPLIRTCYNALVHGGRLVISIEHPILTAPSSGVEKEWSDVATGQSGEPSWLLNSYHNEGERVNEWFVKGVVKQHRTMSTYINLLIAAGFQLSSIQEFTYRSTSRPNFLLIACNKV
eukprot:gene3640-4174_t